jgi:hypothetical protein
MSKCPICGAENPPETSSCHRCGFSLGGVAWPDIPSVKVSEAADGPPASDLPESTSPSPVLEDVEEIARSVTKSPEAKVHLDRVGAELPAMDVPSSRCIDELPQDRPHADSECEGTRAAAFVEVPSRPGQMAQPSDWKEEWRRKRRKPIPTGQIIPILIGASVGLLVSIVFVYIARDSGSSTFNRGHVHH